MIARSSLPKPVMAVVTRTKNRGVLLRRAMESVTGQYNRTFHWVIVNDGGARADVEAVADEARRRGVSVIVIHHAESIGMEAASNAGLAASASEFVAIHDDDDTWDPHFIPETISYLDRHPLKGGVVVKTMKVVERIDSKGNIRFLSRKPFNPEMHSVHLSEMAECNLFPPISFVYRRSVIDAIGNYDSTLPVLGDWEFNLRFLSRFDIGVHPGTLANYHFRPADRGAAGNTVAAGLDLHVEWDAAIRNRMLRNDLDAGIVGLGHLVAAGRRNVTLDKTLQPMLIARSFAKRAYHGLRRVSGKAA
jgi:cellulose synthase/poly-beta-1,6-N-acetylglucosamine synthase-like glycosyltransferase